MTIPFLSPPTLPDYSSTAGARGYQRTNGGRLEVHDGASWKQYAQLQEVGTLAGAQTFTGVKTFSVAPVLPAGSITIANISATGTPSTGTYLRGDGTWSPVSSGSSAGAATLHEEWYTSVQPFNAGLYGTGGYMRDGSQTTGGSSRVNAPNVNILTITNPNAWDEVWEIDGYHIFGTMQTARAYADFLVGTDPYATGVDLSRGHASNGEDRISIPAKTVRVPAGGSFTFGIYQGIATLGGVSQTRVRLTLLTNKGDKGDPGPAAPGGVTLDTAQTITGTKTFSVAPVLPAGSVALANIAATGAPSVNTYLRGDGTWAPVSMIIDNGDGTWSQAPMVADNGDGTFTLNGATDNGDGTYTI